MLDTLTKRSPNPMDRHIGARIRMRRVMLNRSQEWLGDALGLTFQQVQKYEKGVNRVGGSRMAAIAQLLEVPVGYFYEDPPGGLDLAQFAPPPELSSRALRVACDFEALSDKAKNVVATLISGLAEAGD